MAEPALPGLEDIAPSDLSFAVAFLRDHGFASVRSLFHPVAGLLVTLCLTSGRGAAHERARGSHHRKYQRPDST